MAKKKEHQKRKVEVGVIGPDGNFYKVGQTGQVELRRCYDAGGKNRGMSWCHKSKDLSWRKVPHDEIRRYV